MKTAAEYAKLAEKHLDMTEGCSCEDPAFATYQRDAQVYATLAQAAATLEAAHLMGPTPEDQARLDVLMDPQPGVCIECGCAANIDSDLGGVCEEYPGCSALMETKPAFYCTREWGSHEAVIRGTDGKAHVSFPHYHRCIYQAGHEHDEPHYCACGSEL